MGQKSPTHAGKRYAELALELQRELSGENDTERVRSEVARRLGAGQSTVNRLLNGERTAGGLESIEAAIVIGRIDPAFFWAPLGTSYRGFVRELLPGDQEALQAFLGEGSAAPVTPDERTRLRAWAAGSPRAGLLAADDFASALAAMRTAAAPIAQRIERSDSRPGSGTRRLGVPARRRPHDRR